MGVKSSIAPLHLCQKLYLPWALATTDQNNRVQVHKHLASIKERMKRLWQIET